MTDASSAAASHLHKKSAGYGARLAARTSADFAAEERNGLVLAAKVRLGILSVVMLWLAVDLRVSGIAYAYELGNIGVYMVTGIMLLLCARHAVALPYSVYAIFAFDVAFMGFSFTHTNPFIPFPDFPSSILLRLPNFVWFFIILMQAAFALTPRLVIWCGLNILLVRGLQVAIVWFDGDYYTEASLALGNWQGWLDARYDPNFVSLQARTTEVIFTLGMTAGLAALARRTRGLVLKRVAMERERASLARYFSPNMVDTVTEKREELERVRTAEVTVMFVDIKGFTRICEHMPPDDIADLLREYYRRLTEIVFAHQGTLDKFLGDGVMATFGTPTPRASAAADALSCGFAIIDEVDRWNEARREKAQAPIAISIGLHHGPALIGNIGDERRLEFAVVGDTVNVSSRVEGLTRRLDTKLAVTDECIAAVRQGSQDAGRDLSSLTRSGEHLVKGRDRPVGVWCLAA